MGFSEKSQQVEERGVESETRKWVIAGMTLRRPLKPIYTTTPVEKTEHHQEEEEEEETDMEEEEEEEECSTTPKGEESRIPATLKCPPPPRKPKPSLKCNFRGGAREFFTPPDLETVFIRHVERVN